MLKRWCFLWMIKINYTERRKKNWKITEKCLSLQRERRCQVEPRCAERWHGYRLKPVEMMSNSTLPLGFLHSNIELATS